MKRTKIAGWIAAAAVGMALTGSVSATAGEEPLRIVTTIFPEYDWVKQIAGEQETDVTMLLDTGVDMHNYQPTAADIMKIATCDLFIYVGGESDEWVEAAIANTGNSEIEVINLLDALGEFVKEEELVEGMEGEEEEEEDDAEEEGPELDEHVWLSLNNAQLLVNVIAEKMGELDASNKDLYAGNAKTYCEELEKLDAEYAAAVAEAQQDTLLFGDRFPFRYMVDDYGLNYYGAFAGCSAETEASFETVTFLAGKVDELGLRAVMVIDGSDQRIAQTIISNTETKDQEIISMNSMQGITAEDVKQGAVYLEIMKNNLEALKRALV